MVLESLQGELRALRTLQAPDQVVFDPAVGKWLPGSGAFRAQSDGGISIDLEEALVAEGRPLDYAYPRVRNAVGLVAHRVERLIGDGFKVTHEPIEADPLHGIEANPFHGEAKGKLSSSKRQRLAEECEVIVAIDGNLADRYRDERLARAAQKAMNGNVV